MKSELRVIQKDSFRACEGQTIAFELASNPTTGNMWLPKYDKDALRLTSSRYSASGKSFGGGGKQVFYFKVLTPSPSVIEFVYKNPISNKEIARKSFKLRGRLAGSRCGLAAN